MSKITNLIGTTVANKNYYLTNTSYDAGGAN